VLSLDSPDWVNLAHAYGSAADIPQLLRQLESFPSSEGNAEPWLSLWSALAHQGDVYSASFAAVPHVVRVLSIDPARVSFDYFQFPAWVEICRQRHQLQVPTDLSAAYFQSIKRLASLVGEASSSDWDESLLAAAMSALAVSKGFARIGEIAQELDAQTSEELLHYLESR
jgi:hypothetical protein